MSAQQMIGTKAGALVLQTHEALHKQPGPNQKHDRESNFADHKYSSQMLSASTPSTCATAFFESFCGIDFQTRERWDCAKNQTAQN